MHYTNCLPCRRVEIKWSIDVTRNLFQSLYSKSNNKRRKLWTAKWIKHFFFARKFYCTFCHPSKASKNNDNNKIFFSSPVSPSQVTITGPTEARQGDVVNFHCVTAPSHPPAEIRWTVDGRQRRINASRTDPSNEGGWITSSNISITVDSNKRSFSLLCQGINMQLADNVMTTHTLHILCKYDWLPTYT